MGHPSIGTDRAAGILFLVVGAAGLWFGRDLAFGALTNIGPGFLPKICGWGLFAIGVYKLLLSFLHEDDSIGTLLPRPMLLVAGAFVVFGALIERAGLVIAIAAMLVAVEFAGSHAKSVRALLILVVALTAFSLVVFRYVLGIPLEIFTSWN
ncbi:tripartite tricarboxylate transporter TctB family protein [Variovorax paradoxus]|uniref:tripartite tricarboxylate transporter TctB family protein n=1 Tax=Variovorax paradoxus TaxID=34073 RepID=UPI0019320AA0|nr:tripartite tricarboxylate transporter TctB family protein [Variovorax paradoxus]